MANIRIKDIPTTASSTSSTDFIGIDGSANGTRKLSAYSPTFGGNLTVSGTGTSTIAGPTSITDATDASSSTTGSLKTAGGLGVAKKGFFGDTVQVPHSGTIHSIDFGSSTDYISLNTGLTPNEWYFRSVSGKAIRFSNFQGFYYDSTGYSKAAWGTTGVISALGLGNSVYTDNSTAASGTLASAVLHSLSVGQIAASNTGITITDAATLYIPGNVGASTNVTLTNSWGLWNAGKTKLGGDVSISSTTDSSSTTTGALVVSGGVGIAKKLVTGDNITVTNGTYGVFLGGDAVRPNSNVWSAQLTLSGYNADDNQSIILREGGASAINYYSIGGTTSSVGHRFFTGGVKASQTLKAHINDNGMTLAGTITTGAPSSGTAKAWKLGEVASVSPTSPNRTIRVEIDGTVYYISAKTTND